jgi:undecaprenyl-diphosphatase
MGNGSSAILLSMQYVHLFSAFTSHLEAIVTQGGYVFLFITTLLEGVPLVGMLVPGHISIIIAGFLGKVGILNIYWVGLIALVGAIAGDYIGFYLGRKYGMSFIDRLRPYFFVTQAHIDKTHKLLDNHTGKAMIIGRFSPVTRALMPFLVGTSKTPASKFWLFNVIGAISWTVVSLAVGYIFGAGYGAAAQSLGTFTIFAVIASLVIIWGYYFVNVRFHIFKKYELFVLILNLIALYVLSKTIQDAWAPHSFMANFDVYVNMFMERMSQAHVWLRALALWVTTIGGTTVIAALGMLATIILAIRHRWRSAAIMFFALGSTGAALGVLKTFFMRVRPDNALITIVNDPSFPSGHAGMAAAFFVIIAYLLVRRLRSRLLGELVIVCCVLATLAIGLSRVALNVHWASDVIAGWGLGVFLATASILLVRYIGALFVADITKQSEPKK